MKIFVLLLVVGLAGSATAFAFVPDSKKRHAFLKPNNMAADRNSKHNNQHMDRPPVLDGTYPGDWGFDPLGFVKTKDDLVWYREAEVKHARFAMLAAVGWPLSELWHRDIAAYFDAQPILDATGRAPSPFNGGLDRVPGPFWVTFFVLAALIEFRFLRVRRQPGYKIPGDYGFDPLGLYPSDREGQRQRELAEIRNGRLAMVAIGTFAVQEWVHKLAIVELTPQFFKPAWQLMDQTASTSLPAADQYISSILN